MTSSPPVITTGTGSETPQRAGHSSLPSLVDAFSDDAIIRALATWRVGLAQRRNEKLFLHRIRPTGEEAATHDAEAVFPPRRLWHKRRARHRGTRPGLQLNKDALIRTMRGLRHREDLHPWAVKLNAFIRKVQHRAMDEIPLRFEPPRVIHSLKERGGVEYRPLCAFPLQEKVIGCIAARYLRECLDPVFDGASLAFRCARGGKPAPRHHDAVRKILNIRRWHSRKSLYVAECDIRGFFDCVDHQYARQAVHAVVKEAQRKTKGLTVDPRVLAILDAYLDCYTFPRNVKRWEEPKLKARDSDGFFKWPESELREFHEDPSAAAIGVPQGGALSGIVANCLLHRADKALRRLARDSRPTFCYLRYCDDMIILSPDRVVCNRAFKLYCRELRAMGLPLHPASKIGRYGKSFWEGKSRAPYRWGSGKRSGTSPWIQFVGYQVRHDGLVRVRKRSIEKHCRKITDAANELLRHIKSEVSSAGTRHRPVRKNQQQIEHRFHMRVLSMSVGRRAVWHDLAGPLPMSWCAGFECLDRQPAVISQLKGLDRHRERQLRRVSSALSEQCLPEAAGAEISGNHLPDYYGHPFSYVGQFRQSNVGSKART